MSVSRFPFVLALVALAVLSVAARPSAAQQVLGDTGEQIRGLVFDWTTGRWVVRAEQNVIFDTALDPNRNVVDPGSMQQVNYQQHDAAGVLWHYTGWRWTSHGRPHSDISRRALTGVGPGVDLQQSQTQIRSGRPGAGGSRPNAVARPNLGGRQPQRGGGVYDRW